MKIIKVDESNIEEAGRIHSESWKESHRSFCSEEFVEKHTPAAQADFLRRETVMGKQLYMLIVDEAVGVVSVDGNLIENLYVLPDEQRKKYGTQLLEFAIAQCHGTPILWILSNNERAYSFYKKRGFVETGNRIKEKLFETEMSLL